MDSPSASVKVTVQPVVPVGLSTQVGLTTAAVLALVAAATTVLNGDHTTETLSTLAGAVLTLLTVLGGRYAQAAAAIRAVGSNLPAKGPA